MYVFANDTSVSGWEAPSQGLPGVLLEGLVPRLEVWEVHNRLFDRRWDVADRPLPLRIALADGGDQCCHAAEADGADLPHPLEVDGATWTLQVLGVGIDEGRPGEVLEPAGRVGDGGRPGLATTLLAEDVEFQPEGVVLRGEGARWDVLSDYAVVTLSCAEGQLGMRSVRVSRSYCTGGTYLLYCLNVRDAYHHGRRASAGSGGHSAGDSQPAIALMTRRRLSGPLTLAPSHGWILRSTWRRAVDGLSTRCSRRLETVTS